MRVPLFVLVAVLGHGALSPPARVQQADGPRASLYEVVEAWTQHDHLFAGGRGPHKVKISPYDPERHVWVVDDRRQQVFKFTNDGKTLVMTLGEAGVSGTDERHFGRPTDIAWLPDGTFFVSDGYENTRVVKFDRSGRFLMSWGTKGDGPGQFNLVHSLDIDRDRRIYVADSYNRRIQVFDEHGTFLAQWPNIWRPDHVMVSADQHLWVANGVTDQLMQFDLAGRLLSSWGTSGTTPGSLWGIHGFSVDSAGNLYTAETFTGRSQKFRPRAGADRSTLVGPPPALAPWRAGPAIGAPQAGSSAAQTAAAPPSPEDTSSFRIVRLDPGLDAIISSDAILETVGDRFGLTEGPLWVQEGAGGYLLFSDLIANVIYKWTPSGDLSAFLENVYDGPDILSVGQQTRRGRMNVIIIGANGLTLDRQGRLIIASPASRALMRLEADGTRTILADRYDGKRFNGPNDVTVKSNGSIYFTDGNSGLRGGAASPSREIPFNGFYLVKDGRVTLVGSNENVPGGFPNGITLSPDERHLYVTIGRKIMRYEVQPDDTVANGVEFLDVEGNDGLKVDVNGNLFSTTGAGPGEVRITSPEGRRLGTLQLPRPQGEPRDQICATNVGFGDPDGKGLYITACTHVYRIRLNVPGVRPGPAS